jgi:hypothetical protein
MGRLFENLSRLQGEVAAFNAGGVPQAHADPAAGRL